MTEFFAVTGPRQVFIWLSTRLAIGLIAVTAAASAITFFVRSVLTGVPAMNGSARGTALVLLVVGVPTMTVAMLSARQGSARGQVVWIGATAYCLYNAVMFCFATPFNRIFLLYVAMLSLAFWTLVTLFRSLPVTGERPGGARWIAVYVWVIVVLNTLAWLAQIVPAAFAERPTSFLDASGMSTNTLFVQDLALWLPAMALAALLLWQWHPWGLLVTAAGLVFWQIEALGVAVDQWFGHRTDPSSSIASTTGMWLFVALFVIGLVPTLSLLRKVP